MKLLSAIWPLAVAVALAVGGGYGIHALATGKLSPTYSAQQLADAKATELGYVPECVNKSTVVDGKRYRFAYKSEVGRTCYIYVDGGQIKPRDIVEW